MPLWRDAASVSLPHSRCSGPPVVPSSISPQSQLISCYHSIQRQVRNWHTGPRAVGHSVLDFQPTTQPTKSMSYRTSAYFGSPRGLISYCNTYPCHLDTVGVWGSSPHGPTIVFTEQKSPENFTCNSSPVNWRFWLLGSVQFIGIKRIARILQPVIRVLN